jgi:hypothetical protein
MMRTILGYTTLVALSLMMAPRPSVAHHALAAEFDFQKRGEFTGTLTKFAIINPHVRWYFDVKKPDGTMTKWELTAGSPSTLRANGLLRIFTTGTTYKVTYMPARNGDPVGRVIDFIFPDGRVITLFHQDPNNPNDL